MTAANKRMEPEEAKPEGKILIKAINFYFPAQYK